MLILLIIFVNISLNNFSINYFLLRNQWHSNSNKAIIDTLREIDKSEENLNTPY